jgi:hypothetical protein
LKLPLAETNAVIDEPPPPLNNQPEPQKIEV